jgi:hypothetical protein
MYQIRICFLHKDGEVTLTYDTIEELEKMKKCIGYVINNNASCWVNFSHITGEVSINLKNVTHIYYITNPMKERK